LIQVTVVSIFSGFWRVTHFMNFSPQEWNSAVAAYNVGSHLVVTQCDYRRSCLFVVGTWNCSERYSILWI